MFVGIDSVVFGTSDLGAARKFFTDWGLETVEDGRREKIFATEIGSRIVVRAENASGLAPPPGPAGGFREVVWGVRGKRDLARLAKELGADRALEIDPDGTIHTTDPNGIGIGFRVWRHRKRLSVKAAAFNTGADRARIDAPGPLYDEGRAPPPPRPCRLPRRRHPGGRKILPRPAGLPFVRPLFGESRRVPPLLARERAPQSVLPQHRRGEGPSSSTSPSSCATSTRSSAAACG